MKLITFQEAVNAFKTGNYQLVANYVDQGNPLLQFNGDELIEVELIYLVSGSTVLNNSIREIVNRDANLNERTTDKDQYTAVHFAAWDNKTDILEFLLQSGADPNLIGGDGLTALYLACVNGNIESVKYLVQSGANLNYLYNGAGIEGLSEYFSKVGGTVLRGAIVNLQFDIAWYLIEHGAKVEELNEPCRGYTLSDHGTLTYDFIQLLKQMYNNNNNLSAHLPKEKFQEFFDKISIMISK